MYTNTIIYLFLEHPDYRLVLNIFSDGENVVNCVTLKPSCNITFNKTEWKKINSKKSPEKVLEHYSYPILKIIDFELAQNESTSVIVLTKIKERLYILKVCD